MFTLLSLYLRKYELTLETEQKRSARLIPGMGGSPRDYLIEMYKKLRGHGRVDVEMLSSVGESQTSVHTYNARMGSFKTEVHRNFIL